MSCSLLRLSFIETLWQLLNQRKPGYCCFGDIGLSSASFNVLTVTVVVPSMINYNQMCLLHSLCTITAQYLSGGGVSSCVSAARDCCCSDHRRIAMDSSLLLSLLWPSLFNMSFLIQLLQFVLAYAVIVVLITFVVATNAVATIQYYYYACYMVLLVSPAVCSFNISSYLLLLVEQQKRINFKDFLCFGKWSFFF